MLDEYLDIFCSLLNNSFSNIKDKIKGKPYWSEGPLLVVQVNISNNSKNQDINDEERKDELNSILKELDKNLLEKKEPSIYIRRNVRIYSGNSIYIIKSNQKRYWTKSSAMQDADDSYVDIMQSFMNSGYNEHKNLST